MSNELSSLALGTKAFDYACKKGISTVEELEAAMPDIEKENPKYAKQYREVLRVRNAVLREEKKLESFDIGSMLAPVTVNTDYAEAARLNAEILNCAKTAQENLYQMAVGFKRMRDEKLYIALGYSNFAEYCEKAVEINRQNVYKYIKLVENLPMELVSSKRQIGKEKLYLLASIADEEQRAELIETVSIEDTSVKELKAKIEELTGTIEKEREQVRFWQNAQKETTEENQKLRRDRVNAMNRADDAERTVDKLNVQIKELSERAAESVIVEVEVPETIAERDEALLRAETAEKELMKLREDTAKVYSVKMTDRQYEELLDILADYPELLPVIKYAQKL